MVKPTSNRRGLVIAAAASALYAFLLGRRAIAQEQPLDNGTDGSAAALAALRAELEELQRRVDRMDNEGSRIRAPLVVVDEAGTEIFSVGTFGSGPYLRIGAATAQNCTITAGSLPALTFAEGEGDASVYIKAGRDPLLLIAGDAGTANLGTLGNGDQGPRQGISVNASNGNPIFTATTNERDPFVVYDQSGKSFFSVSRASDRPRVVVGEPTGPGLFVGGTENGFSMSLLDAAMGERLVMSADATDTVLAINNGGRPVAQIGTIGNTPTMILGDPNAANLTATATPGGDGASIVLNDQSAAERVAISTAGGSTSLALKRQGDVPLLTVTDIDQDSVLTLGDGAAANLTASIRANGDGFISLKDTSNAERFGAFVAADTASITLYSADAEPFFDARLQDDVPVLEVGKASGASALLTVSPDKTGGRLSLRDDGHTERVLAKADTADSRITLIDVTDKSILDVGIAGGVPRLVVGNSGEASIAIGVTTDSAGSFLSTYDSSGTERASITAVAGSTSIEITDTSMFAQLGTVDSSGDRYGLYMGKGETTLANLRFGDDGAASMGVGNGGPKLVAGVVGTGQGGRFIAFNGSGDITRAAMGANEDGGYFNLGDDAGILVHAEASGHGNLTVDGSSGSIVLIGGADAPRLELGVGGQALVQLGITTDGVGKVLTGPGNGGPAGSLGAGLEIASSIQGRPGG